MRFRTMIKDACRRILRVGFAGRKVNGIEGWEKITAKSAGSSFRMLKPYLKNSEVFIDIGANTGAFTQKVIERKPDIQVHLFEPVPAYYQKCKEKFGDNEKIMMNMLALSDNTGKAKLFLHPENLGWNTMIKEKISQEMKELTIDTMIFDEYAEKNTIERIDIIKIDVEGAEYKVLKGMKQTLPKLLLKPVILCEIGWGCNSHPRWGEEIEVFEWLFSIGYKRFNYNKIKETRDVLSIPIPK